MVDGSQRSLVLFRSRESPRLMVINVKDKLFFAWAASVNEQASGLPRNDKAIMVREMLAKEVHDCMFGFEGAGLRIHLGAILGEKWSNDVRVEKKLMKISFFAWKCFLWF